MKSLTFQEPDYLYHAEVERVVDGDTVYVTADQGFGNSIYLKLRLNKINTAEIRGAEREEGLLDKAFVDNLLEQGDKIVILSHKDGGFGRWAADIWFQPDPYSKWIHLNSHLVEQGIAEEV